MSKLFTIGNLHTGDVFAVEAVKPFDTIEIHGPFRNEHEANQFAHKLAVAEKNYDRIEVIILDLKSFPTSTRILRDTGSEFGYKLAETPSVAPLMDPAETERKYGTPPRRGLSDMRRDLGRVPTAQEWADERR